MCMIDDIHRHTDMDFVDMDVCARVCVCAWVLAINANLPIFRLLDH